MQIRETLHDSAADEIDDRVGNGRVGQCVALQVAAGRAPVLGHAALEAGPGEDVHGERHAEFLGTGPEGVEVGVAVRLGRVDVGGDGEAAYAELGRAVDLGNRALHVGQGQAADTNEAVAVDRAVVEHPVVVVAEGGVAHLVIGNGKGEHRQARIHHLADDAVLGLLVEPSGRIHHAGVEAVVALLDAGMGGRVGQAGAGNAQPAHRNGADAAGQHQPGARLVVVVLADERRPIAEPVRESCIDLGCLDHVRVTRVVPHRFPLLLSGRPYAWLPQCRRTARPTVPAASAGPRGCAGAARAATARDVPS